MIQAPARTQETCYHIKKDGKGTEILLLNYSDRRYVYHPVARVPSDVSSESIIRAVERWFVGEHSADYQRHLMNGYTSPVQEWNKIRNHNGLDNKFDV